MSCKKDNGGDNYSIIAKELNAVVRKMKEKTTSAKILVSIDQLTFVVFVDSRTSLTLTVSNITSLGQKTK